MSNKILIFVDIILFNLKIFRKLYWEWKSNYLYHTYDKRNEDQHRILKLIEIIKPISIIDIGCGPGRLLNTYIDKSLNLYLFDISTNNLKIIEEKLKTLIFRCKVSVAKFDIYVDNLNIVANKDLIILNKVLGSIDYDHATKFLISIYNNFDYIYLCETDINQPKSLNWNVRDYKLLLDINGIKYIKYDYYYVLSKNYLKNIKS